MNGLEKIVNKILSEAQEYGASVISEAEKRAEEISAGYREKAAELVNKYETSAEKDSHDRILRAEATAETASRRAILGAKSRLLDSVFEEALKSLKNLGGEEYFGLLRKLTVDAVNERLSSEQASKVLYGDSETESVAFELMLSESDAGEFGDRLVEAARSECGVGDRLSLSGNCADIDGGILLKCGDIEISASLSSLVASAREKLEGEVCRILFD